MSDLVNTKPLQDKINKGIDCLKEIKHQNKLLKKLGFNVDIKIVDKGFKEQN